MACQLIMVGGCPIQKLCPLWLNKYSLHLFGHFLAEPPNLPLLSHVASFMDSLHILVSGLDGKFDFWLTYRVDLGGTPPNTTELEPGWRLERN